MNRTTILAVATLAIAIGSLHYIAHQRTCAADNQAYHTVLKNWGKTNVIDLSRVLTRMQNDKCKVGGGA